MTYHYKTIGVCARNMTLNIDQSGILRDLAVEGGCHGNARGMELLVKNRDAREVMKTLKGVKCEKRSTSCPDQLACAIEEALQNNPEV